MTPPADSLPPDAIVALARARAAARATRDWPRADALRAEVEAAGWKVVDRGQQFELVAAAPATVQDGGRLRHGSAATVPSLLDLAPTFRFSVHLLADDWPDDLTRALAGLRAHAPAGTQVVIVANDPSPAQASRLEPDAPDLEPVAGLAPEVAWTSARLGHAAARNVGLRRAAGEVVVLGDTSVEATGDVLGPLADALRDPAVAVAGALGLVSPDLRQFEESAGPAVDAIGAYWQAFRRDDYRRLGPLDEKFVFYRNLDVWWSLVLRAGAGAGTGPDAPGAPIREARRVALPLVFHEHRAWTAQPEAERDRLSKRNFYRVLDRFRDRADELLLSRRERPGQV